MITKKNLWFLTLFSIILVMSVYYISVPGNQDMLVNNEVSENKDLSVSIGESEIITALRVERDEALEHEVEAIKKILNGDGNSEEKSNAYQSLKNLNTNKGTEEKLESLIKTQMNYVAFVKIDGTKVKVTVDSDKHSYDLANNIIKLVQNEMKQKVYVTVTFTT